jgi:hypothetical protein
MCWRRKIGARVSFDMGEEFAAMPEPAIIFPDRLYSEEWRVEWVDDDGACEVAIFAGPNARERGSDTLIGNMDFSRRSASTRRRRPKSG